MPQASFLVRTLQRLPAVLLPSSIIVLGGIPALAATTSVSPATQGLSTASPSVAGAATAAGGSSGCAWTEIPTPKAGSPNNWFAGVAALSPSDVWAVGGYGTAGGDASQL